MLGKEHVARDDRLFGDGRPTCESETGADFALVHLRAFGEPRLLRVLCHDAVECLHILKSATHQNWVVNALAVVREDANLSL